MATVWYGQRSAKTAEMFLEELTVRSSAFVRTQNSFLYMNPEPAGSHFADFHTSLFFEKQVLA